MPRPLLLQVSLRIFRVGLLVAAVCLIREHEARHGSLRREPLSVERVRDFFPKAASLDAEPGTSSLLAVRDSAGAVLGFVTETSPASDKIIGYSGPTNSLLAFDAAGALMGTRVLRSGDTPDHLAEVISERPFFAQFRGLKMGGHAPEVQAVSGATLTLRVADGGLEETYAATRTAGFGAEVKRRILLGSFALSAGYYDAYYGRARGVLRALESQFRTAFEAVDLIASPTTPGPAFALGEKSGDPLAMYLSDIFTTPASLAGLPAVALPCGSDAAGLPLSLQLMAAPLSVAWGPGLNPAYVA